MGHRSWVLMIFLIAVLLSGFSGHAMATNFFVEGDLIQVVYQKGGLNEVATDLGPISTWGGLTAAYSGGGASIGAPSFPPAGTGVFSGAAWSDLQVGYFVLETTTVNGVNAAWTSGPQSGQTDGSRQWASFNSNATAVQNGYSVAGTAQVTGLQSGLQSYVTKMDLANTSLDAGYFGGFITAKNGEQNLAGVSTEGHVDSFLYYYANAGSGTAGNGIQVTTIRTFADGTSKIIGSAPNQYTLTITMTGTGSGTVTANSGTLSWSGNTGTASYSSGTAVTLTAAPVSGSSFAGWSGGGCSGAGTCTVTINDATAVTAIFTLNSFSVTPSAGSGGSISPSAPQTIAYSGTTSFTLTPNAGYYIASVTGCGGKLSGSTYTTGPVTANCNVSATFAQTAAGEYLLSVSNTGSGTGTVSSTPAGISCGSTCSSQYTSGTAVTLSAEADSDSSFTGWSGGGCSGTGTCVVTMNAAIAVTATFNTSTPTCTYTLSSSSATFTASGGTGTVTVEASSTNCSWTASSNNTSWIKITSGSSGTGNGAVDYSVSANTGTTQQTGTITIAGQTYSVTQAAGQPALNNTITVGTYSTYPALQNAYTTALTGVNNTIEVQPGTFGETLNFNRNVSVALIGGYSSNFSTAQPINISTNSSNSVITGALTISSGTVTVRNIIIQPPAFADVPGNDYYFSYIEAINRAGIVQGCGNGDYCPSQDVTMGQIAAFLTSALLGPNFTSYSLTPYFTDVPPTNPYFKYVQRLVDDGITTVPANGLFNVNSNVTMDQMAPLLVMSRQIKLGLSPVYFSYSSTPWFSDVPSQSADPNFQYVQYLKENNIWSANDPGSVAGKYNPNGNITNDQMSAYLARAFLGMK